MSRWLLLIFIITATPVLAKNLYVYGPGGPAPAMKEAAAIFGKLHHIDVHVIAGPTSQWIGAARSRADLIYSGSENMMTDFVGALQGQMVTPSITPMYLRPAVILVRPGNPDHIVGFKSLLDPHIHLMVVQGAGQTGLWEDVVGRSGHIATIAQLRRNIVYYAPNSALALSKWKKDHHINAWLIYNIWAIAHPGVAHIVYLSPRYEIYRDCDIALTRRGLDTPLAVAFKKFLLSQVGVRIFHRWGWSRNGYVSTAS